VAALRLFASARVAAGRGDDTIDASTVGEILALAVERYGAAFAEVLPTCKVWVNGEPADPATPVGPADEIAVLPPVSGG
jgi:sulfur-carrier protein